MIFQTPHVLTDVRVEQQIPVSSGFKSEQPRKQMTMIALSPSQELLPKRKQKKNVLAQKMTIGIPKKAEKAEDASFICGKTRNLKQLASISGKFSSQKPRIYWKSAADHTIYSITRPATW